LIAVSHFSRRQPGTAVTPLLYRCPCHGRVGAPASLGKFRKCLATTGFTASPVLTPSVGTVGRVNRQR